MCGIVEQLDLKANGFNETLYISTSRDKSKVIC